MSAMLLDSRPPGRGPPGRGPASAGSASSSRRPGGGTGGTRRDSTHQQQAPHTQQPLLRAATAGPTTSTGYRRLREPLEQSSATQEGRRIRDSSSRGTDAWVMVDPDSSTNRCSPGPAGSRENTPTGLLSERRPSGLDKGIKNMPRPHTEGPFRRPLRPRPVTAATPTEGRSSVLSCHSKRIQKIEAKRLKELKETISRTSRRSRPASSFDDRKSKGDVGGDSDSDNDQPTKRDRAPSSVDFFSGTDLPDTGWDTDLEPEEPPKDPGTDVKESYDVTGRAIYLESCRKNGVIPASYFLRHMQDTNLEMKHHGLGPAGVKPLAVALVSNTSVISLNLKDNWLGAEGGFHVCEMLKENCYITHVDLSENKLGVEFSIKFMDVLNHNSTLTHITLSGNDLDDRAAGYLSEAIMNTTKLEYIDLSHNHFGEAAGESLGLAISENSSIKHMDLSWNCIRRRGAVAVANGIKNNVLMQSINLSWNGFGNDGASALGEALKENSCLEQLDVSNNRINTEGSVLLAKGLTHNDSLKVLKMGKNPMQSAGCYGICAALLKNPNAVMEVIDFTDILINNDFLDVFKQVKELLPDLKLRHGGDAQPKKPKIKVHPMVKLKNYIEKNNLRLVDFFNKFDKDNSMSVTREEFAQGIEETGIKLSQEEVAELLDELDKDGDGEIMYSELVIGHQDFKEPQSSPTPSSPGKENGDSKVWKT